jgi:hypothetical protein
MQIEARQMKALGASMRDRFERDALAMLRRTYPAATADRDDALLLRFVRHGIERARLAELQAVTDIERWLCLMMRLGPNFDSDPELVPIHAALSNVEVYGPLRLDAVEALAERVAPEPT